MTGIGGGGEEGRERMGQREGVGDRERERGGVTGKGGGGRERGTEEGRERVGERERERGEMSKNRANVS